jgi:DNA-binding transcriptional MerR regulator
MDGKIITYAILLLAIIGGVTGFLYTTDVDEARKDFILTQQQLGQTEESLKQTLTSYELRKEATAIITVAHIINRENEALRTEIRTLKQKRDELAKAFKGTIQRVREDSVGLVLPEIPLTTGSTLKNAKLQAVDDQLTVIQHSEGVSKVPTSTLPATLLDRFRFGFVPGSAGSIINFIPDPDTSPTQKPPAGAAIKSPERSSSTSTFRSTTSDALVRMAAESPREPAKKNPVPVGTTYNDPKIMEIEGNPALWQSVERQSIGRAYIPGQGWLKIGSKGPIPGSGRK